MGDSIASPNDRDQVAPEPHRNDPAATLAYVQELSKHQTADQLISCMLQLLEPLDPNRRDLVMDLSAVIGARLWLEQLQTP